MGIDIGSILNFLGDKTSYLSQKALEKISELLGKEPSDFIGKIITLIILVGLIFLGSKLTQKVAKFVLILLSIILIISILYSIFL